MSSNAALLVNIKQALIDLRSDKSNVRAHGLSNFHSILDNRSSDLSLILRSTTNRHNDDDDSYTWTNLFDDLHSAIREQCQRISGKSSQSQKSLISKNDEYKEALRKCINVANEQIPHVAYKRICHSAFECFDNANIAMYFDTLYLQIVYKHILNAKHSIGELLVTDWSRLLSHVFELLNKRDCQIQKLELLQCIPLILQHAAKYTYLVSDLDQYLSNIVEIVNEEQLQNQINAQKQIFLIVHEFMRNLAINRRSSIVSFSERILDKILKFYQFTMDPDSKVMLFKIMHIAIVVHYPEPVCFDAPCSGDENPDETNDLFKQQISHDIQLWHKHLRNMLSVIEREIGDSRKRSIRLNPAPVICSIFVRMAAKLCSVVFWKNDVWNSSACDEQQQKRRRHSMMLEKLMDLVEYEKGKFCWRWFAILSQLIVDFDHVLRCDDYQALLNLITEYKATIQHPLHMGYFIRITEVMLRKRQELNQNSASFCVEHWHKIMELSFKQAETDKTQLENVDLMRVLIDNKVIVSHDFIKNIIIAIAKTQTIRKSNGSIRLLISVLQNVNVDMIGDIYSLKVAIIHWLCAKFKLTDLRKVIENNNTTDRTLCSELYVLCVLSRQGSTCNKIDRFDTAEVNQDDFEVRNHTEFIAELVQCLQYRMLSKLVVSNKIHSNVQNVIGIEEVPGSNAIKASLNEMMFTEMGKAIYNSNTDNIDNSIESFNNNCSLLAINVNLLNTLVSYESIDSLNFLKFLSKRILIRISQLNEIIKYIGNSYRIESNPNDVNEIVASLLDIWHDKYHPIILKNIFIVQNCRYIIKWLAAQLIPSRRPQSILLAPLKDTNQLEFEERIQLKCLTLLAHFSAYQEEEECRSLKVFEYIEKYEFNHKRNEDLFIDFQLIKIILNQRCPTEEQTDWAFGEIQMICQEHASHNEYMELVIDYIPALVRCIKPYTASDMLDNLVRLISAFLLKCRKRKFSKFACLKIIKGVEYFAQEFFNVEDGQRIFAVLMHFLRSEYFTIQIATVSCLTRIFDKRWLNCNENDGNCLVIQQFHMDLAENLEINDLSAIEGSDIDRKACIASTCIQLFCSIIGKCYALRKEMWFRIIEFCSQKLKLNEGKIFEIIEKLCVEAFHSTTSVLLADLIPYLIGLWIDKNYLLINFPVKLSGCEAKEVFLIDHSDIITLRIIQHKPELIPQLLEIFDTDSLSKILTPRILIKCLAWLTSVNCKPNSSKDKATNMLKILRREKPNIETYFESHALEIIEELFNDVWDAGKFMEFFEIDVEFVTDDSTIDYATFVRSLEYIQRKYSKPSSVIHHFCAVAPRKVINILYVLKLHFQQSTCEEQKLQRLFRVCALIEIITDFIIEYAGSNTMAFHSNTIAFFIRDFIHFFGNVISNSVCAAADKLKLATCKYFHKFCEKILPGCAKPFQSHLNYIVSILLNITKTDLTETKIFKMGMGLLRFLIVEQTDVLQKAIGELDSFPMNVEFGELRQIQHNVKYNGKSFSLLEEIEYFLSVDKRKVEGLLSLKEHLSKKKNELQEIYKTIYDTRGFSEDCEKSPIHRLISTLLTHIVQNVDSEKSLIAAKCLGELGPNDLGSIALKFDNQKQTHQICNSFEEAIKNVCEHALEKLNGIFVHGDATVLQAAADACTHMLDSQMAVSLLNNYPLLKVFETGTEAQWPLKQTEQHLDLSELFNDDAFSKSHSYWVKMLAIKLFKIFDGETLAKVASTQANFAVSMIPLLVKALLLTKNNANHQAMNNALNLFFAKNFAKISGASMEVDNDTRESTSYVYLDKVSIKLMLNVAECIRVQNQNSQLKNRLNLNYLHIAKAALYCEAYFTAILYGELAVLEKQLADNATTEIRSIMKSAYQSIGEIDAVCAFLDPINDKMEYLELNRCWDQILIGCDAQSNDLSRCAHYLGKAGLYNLANKLTNGNNSANYECAWRLADWNIIEGDAKTTNTPNTDLALEFDKFHYFALKNLKKKDKIGVKINVENAFKAVIKMFKQSSYECTKNIYKNLMMLHLLQQIDEFCYIQFPKRDDDIGPEFIINKWNYQDQVSLCGFSYREPILAQRVIMVQSAGLRAKRKIENVCKFGTSLNTMILNLITECRSEGFFNLGERYSATLHKMQLSREMKAETFIEDALLSWTRGEGDIAKHMINAVINEKQPTFTHAKALWMMGEYLADARLEDTNTIIDKYFLQSVSFSTKVRKSSANISAENAYYYSPENRVRLDLVNRKRNYEAIAKYADREYQQISAYKKSTDFERKLSNIKRNKAVQMDMNQRRNSLTTDEKKSFCLVDKSIQIDESDVKSTNTDYEQYLQLAIEYYIQTLFLENETEMCSSAMFRLFGLWLSNSNCQGILKEIEQNYEKIPTHKFIALMPQITAHLSTEGIKDVIQEIVSKCAKHHPHHVLPKIFAIFNAFKDEDFIKDAKQKPKTISSSPRTDAAGQLLQKLKADTGLRDIIVQLERMYEVLIRLANITLENSREFSSKEPILNLRDLHLVHCPTVELPVRISGDYDQSIVGISKWNSKFLNCGGINAPKRIECIGMNGQSYLQLLKGTDDLRQDSVMQQVFSIMNNLLNQSKLTKKDRLHIRTYIVVPLSQRSGIVEWCVATMPLTDYLVGSPQNKGAHERFRPQDWSPSECRRKLSQVPIRTTKFEKTYGTYQEICKNIHPVLHHFFFEYFYNAGVWFERRMAYAHSLATTSMIGYMLGIGDRHVSNILIDKTTAELIHIDFGIAFEQGKMLPTPEQIPFRLTRDLISALGCSGVEGVYRKSCEKTMEVLRENKSTILTIVEVLLHDPLYAWTLTSSAASKRQQTTVHIDEDQDINTMAERALWRLEEKLDGKHVSRSESISVQRHVEILIKEATNEKLLCRLFQGWQPYL